jgi:hypothetical protein
MKNNRNLDHKDDIKPKKKKKNMLKVKISKYVCMLQSRIQ